MESMLTYFLQQARGLWHEPETVVQFPGRLCRRHLSLQDCYQTELYLGKEADAELDGSSGFA